MYPFLLQEKAGKMSILRILLQYFKGHVYFMKFCHHRNNQYMYKHQKHKNHQIIMHNKAQNLFPKKSAVQRFSVFQLISKLLNSAENSAFMGDPQLVSKQFLNKTFAGKK